MLDQCLLHRLVLSKIAIWNYLLHSKVSYYFTTTVN